MIAVTTPFAKYVKEGGALVGTSTNIPKSKPHLSISAGLVRHTNENRKGIREAVMARQHRTSGSLQSIAGGALVGLGLHIWFGNLQGVASQLTHLLGTSSGETLGLAPLVIVAAAQAGRVYASDHLGFFLEALRMLVSFWPLLLVIRRGRILERCFQR